MFVNLKLFWIFFILAFVFAKCATRHQLLFEQQDVSKPKVDMVLQKPQFDPIKIKKQLASKHSTALFAMVQSSEGRHASLDWSGCNVLKIAENVFLMVDVTPEPSSSDKIAVKRKWGCGVVSNYLSAFEADSTRRIRDQKILIVQQKEDLLDSKRESNFLNYDESRDMDLPHRDLDEAHDDVVRSIDYEKDARSKSFFTVKRVKRMVDSQVEAFKKNYQHRSCLGIKWLMSPLWIVEVDRELPGKSVTFSSKPLAIGDEVQLAGFSRFRLVYQNGGDVVECDLKKNKVCVPAVVEQCLQDTHSLAFELKPTQADFKLSLDDAGLTVFDKNYPDLVFGKIVQIDVDTNTARMRRLDIGSHIFKEHLIHESNPSRYFITGFEPSHKIPILVADP